MTECLSSTLRISTSAARAGTRLAQLTRCGAIVVALAACNPGDSGSDARFRYEILHVRWNDGPELVVGTLDGRVLPIRKLEGGTRGAGQLAVSPDGKRVAFSSFEGQGPGWALIVRSLDRTGDEQVLAHTTITARPAWAPDGRQLAYVSIVGDFIGVYVASLDDGQSRPLAAFPRGSEEQERCIAPRWSPDGTEIAYSTIRGITSHDLVQQQARHLVPLGSMDWTCEPAWSPDGTELAFAQPGRIMRIPRTGGDAVPIAETDGGVGTGQVAWAPDGSRLAYVTLESDAVLRIVDSTGGPTRLLDRLNAGVNAGHPQFSPDGQQVLYVRFEAGARLTTVPVDGGSPVDLALEGAGIDASYPIWLTHPILR